MNLGKWLDENGLDRATFAATVGVHPVTVTKWITGRMMPRREALRAIERETKGAVVATDFVDAPPSIQAA